MRAHDLLSIVQEAPQESDAWKKRDANAQKIIVLSLEKKSLMHVINCISAKEMWTKLSNVYQRDNEQQKYTLMQEFFNCTMSKNEDVSTHVSKLQNITHRIKSLGIEITNQMLISKILVTLPDNFKSFVTAWESTSEDNKTVENLISRLLLEEMRNREEEEKGNTVAFKSAELKCNICKEIGHLAHTCKRKKGKSSGREKRCFNCNKSGHFAKDCRKTSGTKEKNLFCKICKKNNHAEKDCYFRDRESKYNRNATEKVSFLTQVSARTSWVVDSGTTSHMVNSKEHLCNARKINSRIGIAKTSETMTVKEIGSMFLEKCTLNEVMYVPDLTVNLLSVNAITENEGEIKFTKNNVVIKHKNKEVLRGDKQENGLYEIALSLSEENKSLITRKTSRIENWHKILGHLSHDRMKQLIGISEGMDITPGDLKKKEKLCDTCMKAKQSRLPFEKKGRTKQPLELIHTDLCGPIDPPTWDGKRYMLTVIDDYTHFSMVYLIRNKHEVTEYLKEYIRLVETKWNRKVSRIKSDNGREYVNKSLIDWAKLKGIEMNYTIPYSPQMNGTAERLNRTIMEKARALLTEFKMKKEMWGEAVRTATYLLNRSPTKVLIKTPYEMWKGEKPNLKNLKLFGCTAYAKILGPLKKLDDRSKKYRFVGYAPQGYRLWDEEKRRITISRDVRFDTDIKKERRNNNIQIDYTRGEIEENDTEQEDREEESDDEEENKGIEVEEEDYSEGTIVDVNSDYEDAEEQRNEEQDMNDVGQVRKSERERKAPKRYGDYVMMLTYQQAITGPDRIKWKEAIKEEKDSLNKNNTWRVVDKAEAGDKKNFEQQEDIQRKGQRTK